MRLGRRRTEDGSNRINLGSYALFRRFDPQSSTSILTSFRTDQRFSLCSSCPFAFRVTFIMMPGLADMGNLDHKRDRSEIFPDTVQLCGFSQHFI